jgi:hypothetical protein
MNAKHDPEKWEPVSARIMLKQKEHDPEKWEPPFGRDHAPGEGRQTTHFAFADLLCFPSVVDLGAKRGKTEAAKRDRQLAQEIG